MSQTALGRSAVRVERRVNRRPDRTRARLVDRLKTQCDPADRLYQRLWREMNRAQKEYLNIVAEQENAIHKVDGSVGAAYQRYELATRTFNHFLKATAA